MRSRTVAPLALLLLAATPVGAAGVATAESNDYPTETRADYVFACMAVNGGSQLALRRCSCAIDVIASLLPYEDYDRADTVLRMRNLAGGYLAQTFRGKEASGFVQRLEEAQAEAEVRCF